MTNLLYVLIHKLCNREHHHLNPVKAVIQSQSNASHQPDENQSEYSEVLLLQADNIFERD